jgi:hypothetical protein
MTTAECPVLLAYLTGVRRRLWRENTLGLVGRAAQGAAAILLAGGTAHWLGMSIAWWQSILAAALPVLAALAFGILRRQPSLDQAAAAADARLGSRQLLASAIEQFRLPKQERPGASWFVIEQAERAALVAHAGRPAGRRRRAPTAALIPLGLGFAGLFLHLQPSMDDRHAMARPDTASGSRQQTTIASDYLSSAILDLKHEFAQLHSPEERASGGTRHGDAAAWPSGALSRPFVLGAEESVTGSATDPTTPANSRARTATTLLSGSGPETPAKPQMDTAADAASDAEGSLPPGTAAEDAAGTDRDIARRAASGAVVEDVAVRYIDVERRPGGAASASPGALFSADVVAVTEAPAAVVPASEPAALPYRSSLHPSLRHYAAEYFAKLRQTP